MSNGSTEHVFDQQRRIRQIARDEGIVLTPAGEPLFERDMAHWREIKAPDFRTLAERAVDDGIEAYEGRSS